MPGYELIGKEELDEIKEIFNNGGILFRHGFDNLRGNTYKVKEFEKNFLKKYHPIIALLLLQELRH